MKLKRVFFANCYCQPDCFAMSTLTLSLVGRSTGRRAMLMLESASLHLSCFFEESDYSRAQQGVLWPVLVPSWLLARQADSVMLGSACVHL